jgi:signal transduction histidine kinase
MCSNCSYRWLLLCYCDSSKKDGYAEIIVKDNGIGIPKELQEKVFDLFTKEKRKGTAGEKSYGLRLVI